MINIKLKRISNNIELPKKMTLGSSGIDISAYINESIIIQPMERKLIPTGIYVEIPVGYEIQVRPRSGLAIKYGITVLNSPGTIDSDYRGEIKVILINLSNLPYTINNKDRIAQIVVVPVFNEYTLTLVEELNVNNTRGDGGFGHTGI